MTKMDYAAQFTATREKKLKSKRARQKIARHLQAALNISTGDALVLFIGHGHELSNLEALESWVAKTAAKKLWPCCQGYYFPFRLDQNSIFYLFFLAHYVLVKPKWTLLIDNFHTQLGSCHH